MKTTTVISAALAIVASTLSISAAVAAPVVMQTSVSYADLNLASTGGQATLDRRIKAAAGQVCGVDASERQMAIAMDAKRCFTAAVSQAHTQVAAGQQPVFAAR